MMTPIKYTKNKPITNSAEEPATACNSITISTVEEQEEANYRYWLCLTPEQRFELHYTMITHFFADAIEKNKRTRKHRIIFEP
jgi:hypothetical protein